MCWHVETGPNSGCPGMHVAKHSCKNMTSNLLSHTWSDMRILTTSVLFFPPSDPLRHPLSNNIRHRKPGPCSSHLLMPVLSKPHHLIHNALQGGQQGWMEFPLHMHDSAAAPHRGSGSDWPRVGSAWVRLGTHRTRLLLPWSIWWH